MNLTLTYKIEENTVKNQWYTHHTHTWRQPMLPHSKNKVDFKCGLISLKCGLMCTLHIYIGKDKVHCKKQTC